jgi:urease accessory protein
MQPSRPWPASAASAVLVLLWPLAASAHVVPELGSGFATGFFHPLTGIDHVLAMLAVGMWGAQLGAPAIWVLPVAFPLVMSVGGVVGILGLPLPGVEPGIALSVIVLGGCIATDQRPPLWLAGLLVSVFAVFHGYAHGAELPHQAAAVAYSAGFVLATGLLHLTGIGIGMVVHLRNGMRLLRAGGALISLAGVAIAWQLVQR